MNKHCQHCPCHKVWYMRAPKHGGRLIREECTMGKSLPYVKSCFWVWLLPKFRYS